MTIENLQECLNNIHNGTNIKVTYCSYPKTLNGGIVKKTTKGTFRIGINYYNTEYGKTYGDKENASTSGQKSIISNVLKECKNGSFLVMLYKPSLDIKPDFVKYELDNQPTTKAELILNGIIAQDKPLTDKQKENPIFTIKLENLLNIELA